MLPADAPFGAVELDVEGCTLCLACVSACPTGALTADTERPMLRFTEDACVQCGLCKATCRRRSSRFGAARPSAPATAAARVLKEKRRSSASAATSRSASRGTIERVAAKLEGKHWMFKGSARRLDVIKMCEDCRVTVMAEEDFDPYGKPRPPVRTTEDYLREREDNERDGKA